MTQDVSAYRPDTREFFDIWMGRFDTGRSIYIEKSAELPAARERVQARKDALKSVEAVVVMNGGTDAVAIDGKNEAARNAQLTVALEGMDEYKAARDDLRAAEYAVNVIDAGIAEGAEMMRGARLALEYGTAWLRLCAAAEGGMGTEQGDAR